MRTQSNILLWFLPIAILLGISLAVNSCGKEELAGDSGFALFYPDISNIGPTSTIRIPVSYRGPQPSNFEITQVTLEKKETITNESFIIDPDKGEISIENTAHLAVGKYYISVACDAGGSRHTFNDLIVVNMMRPAPESIVITPAALDVKLGDLMDMMSELPTAQISTQGEHVTITGYYLSEVRKDGAAEKEYQKLVKVDEKTGLVKVRHIEDFEPGKYTVDFKLTNDIVDQSSEESLFADALTIEVTSEPLALSYVPDKGIIEAGHAFQSTAPVLTGSDRGIGYTMTLTPACDEITIDKTTGVISCAQGNQLKVGAEYKADITVENIFGVKKFEKVYDIEVVDFINPVEKVTYNDVSGIIQTCSFENAVQEKIGDNILYSLKQIPETDPNYAIYQEIRIDPVSGKVTAAKRNEIPVGKYSVTVVAENSKNTLETTFGVEIVENPNMFTKMTWGNNLNLTPAENYASQYRLNEKETVTAECEHDITPGLPVKFSIEKSNPTMRNSISIDEATGKITVTHDAKKQLGVAVVTVKVGNDGDEAQVVKRFPFFVENHLVATTGKEKYRVEYTPFAFCINPVKGDREGTHSVTPTIYKITDNKETVLTDMSRFSIDFRRDFYYWNLNGPEEHVSGQLNAKSLSEEERKSLFIYSIWQEYYGEDGPNIGSREPLSYWDSKPKDDSESNRKKWEDLLERRAAYMLPDGRICVKANRFKNAYGIANGVFFCKVSCAPEGIEGKLDDPNNSAGGFEIHPVAIWFDKKFE